jgi:hypothetical protein
MAVLLAHHDPASQAMTITAKIQANGATVALLCERAQLWRTLSKPHLAIQDYRDAVALEPKSVSMRLKLAHSDMPALKAMVNMESGVQEPNALVKRHCIQPNAPAAFARS